MTDIVINTLGGSTQSYSANELQQSTGCRIITPEADDYDARRAIWNGMIDKRPAAILVAKDEAGIAAAVSFASTNGLLMSLRSGGHNIAGMALCDDGLVLDMQDMKSVTVDPEARTARVQPGASLGDVDRATQEFGLVVPTGINSTTGIAGLALGGGFGWVTRKYGLTVDCLKSVRLVTASGSIITASKTENSDIFWALQGGGGNFGVVTEFTFDLHPVGPEVFAGMLVHPIADFPDVTRALQALVADAPDELTCWAVSRKAPPLPFIPEEWHGREVMVVPFCFIGDLNAAEAATLGVRSIGNPKPVSIRCSPKAHAITGKAMMSPPSVTPPSTLYMKRSTICLRMNARFSSGMSVALRRAFRRMPRLGQTVSPILWSTSIRAGKTRPMTENVFNGPGNCSRHWSPTPWVRAM